MLNGDTFCGEKIKQTGGIRSTGKEGKECSINYRVVTCEIWGRHFGQGHQQVQKPHRQSLPQFLLHFCSKVDKPVSPLSRTVTWSGPSLKETLLWTGVGKQVKLGTTVNIVVRERDGGLGEGVQGGRVCEMFDSGYILKAKQVEFADGLRCVGGKKIFF